MATTVVWIMVMFGHAGALSTGPEFASKERCEAAVKTIVKAANDTRWLTKISDDKTPFCVRIEK